jgi:hypothetical protein
MPTQLCCLEGVPGPAHTPTPGVESIAPLEMGARRGAYRSPDTGVVVTDAPVVEPTSSEPFYVRPPGVPRSLKMPFAYLVRLVRPYDGKGNYSTGAHTDIEVGASTPPGEMIPPREGKQRNTWRAAPAPWDAQDFGQG